MTTEAEKTIISGVRLVRPDERILAAAQTAGMIREEAIQTDHLWAGIARTKPGNTGWHHHGEWETVAYVIAGACRLEFGLGGREVVVGEPGDYIFIPKGVIHRESNPTEGEQALVIVRFGAGPVIGVDGPAAEGELSEADLDRVAGGTIFLDDPTVSLLINSINKKKGA
jgi:uncharacterized RmlC-like cupin family protein